MSQNKVHPLPVAETEDLKSTVDPCAKLQGQILDPARLESASCSDSGSSPDVAMETQPAVPEKDQRRRLLGFLLGILCSLILAVSASCVQGLQGAVPDFQLAAMRGACTFVLVSPVYPIQRELPRVPRRLWGWMFIYSMIVAGYHIAEYVAVRFIPLGVSGCLFRTVLLVSVTFFARLILKEFLTVFKLTAIALSIVATFLVIQPETVFGSHDADVSDDTDDDDGEEADDMEQVYGYLLACLSGFLYATLTIIQKAKFRELPPTLLSFYPAVAKTMVPLTAAALFEEWTFPSEGTLIALAVGQAVAAALVSILGKRAIHMTTAILFSLAMSVQVMFLLVAQYTVLKDIQPGVGNWVEILGVVLVTVAAMLPPTADVLERRCAECDLQRGPCRRPPRTHPAEEP